MQNIIQTEEVILEGRRATYAFTPQLGGVRKERRPHGNAPPPGRVGHKGGLLLPTCRDHDPTGRAEDDVHHADMAVYPLDLYVLEACGQFGKF